MLNCEHESLFKDLRQRMLRAVDQGKTQAEIAKTFTVSVATIKCYLKQRRETGHVLLMAIPGRPARKGRNALSISTLFSVGCVLRHVDKASGRCHTRLFGPSCRRWVHSVQIFLPNMHVTGARYEMLNHPSNAFTHYTLYLF